MRKNSNSIGFDNCNSQVAASQDKLSTRNLLMFSLGTFGRDFVYGLFAFQLLNYILFTKQLTDAQFASITFIIIAARLFDAFNDPIMGGIVENTHSKWGKFKPWQLAGAILTGAVIIAVFSNSLQGGAFIGLLAFLYFMFSITFTMNDISYWGMMPSLTKNEHDRSKLTSLANLVAGAGGGLVGIIVPALTTGQFAINGSAVDGYMFVSIAAVVLMIAFQLFTIIGVKEKPLPEKFIKKKAMTLKEMFKIIFKNDQLMWSALIMIMFSLGTGVVSGGLSMTYIYFEFGYNGLLLTLFGVLFAVINVLFMLFYPWLSKKFSRTKLLYSTGFAIILGYILMMLFGLVIPTGAPKTGLWYGKFVAMAIANGIVGYGQGFYMIMVISMANTVEYNEYKTGNRDEGLIFSIRPFTAKLSSALQQGLVTIVFIVAGVLNVTNKISALENDAAKNLIGGDDKIAQIGGIISNVPSEQKIIILVCMCLIPAIFMAIAMLIYKKKYILDDKKYAEIVKELELREAAANVENSQSLATEITENENLNLTIQNQGERVENIIIETDEKNTTDVSDEDK